MVACLRRGRTNKARNTAHRRDTTSNQIEQTQHATQTKQTTRQRISKQTTGACHVARARAGSRCRCSCCGAATATTSVRRGCSSCGCLFGLFCLVGLFCLFWSCACFGAAGIEGVVVGGPSVFMLFATPAEKRRKKRQKTPKKTREKQEKNTTTNAHHSMGIATLPPRIRVAKASFSCAAAFFAGVSPYGAFSGQRKRPCSVGKTVQNAARTA